MNAPEIEPCPGCKGTGTVDHPTYLSRCTLCRGWRWVEFIGSIVDGNGHVTHKIYKPHHSTPIPDTVVKHETT